MRGIGLLVYVLLAGLLAACGTTPSTTTTASNVPPQPTSTRALPTSTPDTAPTATSAPPTATSAPPTATSAPPTATSVPPTPTPGLDEEPRASLGSPDAPVTIYEFSDYGCPACRHYALFTFPAIKEEYIDTGQVYYVFKDYPVVSRQGGLAAQAAECAGEQGHYWDMHSQLFIDPGEWDNVPPNEAQAVFRRYAQAYEMDADALVACVAAGRYEADVARDVEEGIQIGWFGTPTFFINRKMLSGAQPPEVFREIIERELSTQSP
jgi:protein-disulfide isomerase